MGQPGLDGDLGVNAARIAIAQIPDITDSERWIIETALKELEPGESWLYTASHTVRPADPNPLILIADDASVMAEGLKASAGWADQRHLKSNGARFVSS